MSEQDNNSEWERWQSARLSAMEAVFGPSDGLVLHPPVPFEFGPDAGGAADVITFRNSMTKFIAVTSELIGRDDQVPGFLENYELAICQHNDDPWGPNVISQLAHYTLQAQLNPHETMDISSAVPEGSSLSALLFLSFAKFEVLERSAGVILCLGITPSELSACMAGRTAEVIAALVRNQVHPYSDHDRESVM